MDKQKQALRIGALAIVLAVLLRMICSGVLGNVFQVFAQPQLASFLIQSGSARVPDASTIPSGNTKPTQGGTTNPTSPQNPTQPTVKPTDPTQPTVKPTDPTQPTVKPTDPTKPTVKPTNPTQPTTKPINPPVLPGSWATFTKDDAKLVEMNYSCNLRPNVESLLTQTLSWDLTGKAPSILIIHTHGTEAYTPTADSQYKEFGGDYRTNDDKYNMISIGDELTRLLQEGGLNVIHDRTPYDLNDYLDSYDNARAAIQKHLKENPSIKMVLDLHRDAAERPDGSQWATSATVNGEKSAQLMFVVGTNVNYVHPNWKTNLSIAEKMNVLMERIAPGVTRPIDLRRQRFNQDLSIGSLIVEVGAAGNTHQQAKNSMSVLAEAILELAYGANRG